MRVVADVEFNSEDYLRIQKRYKLEDTMSVYEIMNLWLELKSILKSEISYMISEDGKELTAAMTIGKGFEILQEKYSMKGELLKAYVLDCLSLEALNCLDEILSWYLEREGFYIKKKDYTMPEKILPLLETDICFTTAGMMDPLKSVTMTCQISREKKDRCSHHRCEQCDSNNCPFRQKKQETIIKGAIEYSYGYQKIFGK